MQDSPTGAFVVEEHGAACEALRIPEFECDEDESRTQWLDPEVGRNQLMVRRTAGRMSTNVRENGLKCGIDAARSGDTLGHLGRGMKHGRRIRECRAEWRPIKILESGQEPTECAGHGDGVRLCLGRSRAWRRRGRLARKPSRRRRSAKEYHDERQAEPLLDQSHSN